VGKIISIVNQKGGVGKTTTSINLSAYLAEAGKKVLLIDIDPQANTTSGAGIDKSKITKSIYNVLIDKESIESVIIKTQTEKMHLVPADLNLTGAQIELVSELSREHRLKNSLEKIKPLYDFIIIDCPPSLGLITINALTASDTALIPLQCEYYAMEGLGQLMHTIQLVQENLNPHLKVEGVVLTMADYRTNLTGEVISEAKEHFKDKLFDTIIPRSIRLSEAPGYGQPILIYNNESNGAKAYKALASELISRNSLQTLELQQITTKTDSTITEEESGGDDGEEKSVGQGLAGPDTREQD